MSRLIQLDLGVGDVHAPAAVSGAKKVRMSKISTKTRNALPAGKFALPASRKFPIHDAAHARNAAARLEQVKKAGKISDGDYAKAKRAIARAEKKFGVAGTKGAGGRIHIRADLAAGGSMHVRHMSDAEQTVRITGLSLMTGLSLALSNEIDPKAVGVTLKGPAAYSDGTPKKLVWVNLATAGRFKGHRAGEFELNDAVFRQIKANFDRDKLPVHFDFEHASESGPTEGSIPAIGAPAQGWIHRIEVRASGLWGLTEWLDYARDGIKAGQFGFISPAIRFNSKDRVTGENVGARLTSAALTNAPFLNQLVPPIAASDKSADVDVAEPVPAEVVTLRASLAHAPHEYMPAIKSALRLHELSSATECADHLDKLRDHLDAAGGDAGAMHQGVKLADYLHPLRDMVDAPKGMTWDEVFDVVEDLIHAAIEEHVIEDHGGQGAEMPDGDDDDDQPSGATMSIGPDGITLKTHGPSAQETLMSAEKIAELTVTLKDRDAKIAETTTQLTDTTTKLTAAETEIAKLTLKVGEEKSRADKADEELVALKAWKGEREEKDLTARVDEAFLTYKDKKGLTDASKKTMLIVLKADPAAFETEYPHVEGDKRHLLANLTDKRETGIPRQHSDEGGAQKTLGPRDLAKMVAAQKNIPLAVAQRAVAMRMATKR